MTREISSPTVYPKSIRFKSNMKFNSIFPYKPYIMNSSPDLNFKGSRIPTTLRSSSILYKKHGKTISPYSNTSLPRSISTLLSPGICLKPSCINWVNSVLDPTASLGTRLTQDIFHSKPRKKCSRKWFKRFPNNLTKMWILFSCLHIMLYLL